MKTNNEHRNNSDASPPSGSSCSPPLHISPCDCFGGDESKRRTFTEAEWFALGTELFGGDVMAWQFVCPACGHTQCMHSFFGKLPKGTPGDVVFTNCIGRYLPTARDAFDVGAGPCNYGGGGLFDLRPWTVTRGAAVPAVRVFAFAQATGTRS